MKQKLESTINKNDGFMPVEQDSTARLDSNDAGTATLINSTPRVGEHNSSSSLSVPILVYKTDRPGMTVGIRVFRGKTYCCSWDQSLSAWF